MLISQCLGKVYIGSQIKCLQLKITSMHKVSYFGILMKIKKDEDEPEAYIYGKRKVLMIICSFVYTINSESLCSMTN